MSKCPISLHYTYINLANLKPAKSRHNYLNYFEFKAAYKKEIMWRIFLSGVLYFTFLLKEIPSQPYQPEVVVPRRKGPNYHFCNENLVFTPYLKYYKGRSNAIANGQPEKTYGPGFHADFADPSFYNIYLCINGL